MKKYLWLTLIVIVIVGGLLTLFWFFPGVFPYGQNKNESADNDNLTANQNLNQAAGDNTNQAAVNLNLSVQKGAIEVNKAVTYKDTEFRVLTADKLNTFENQTAGSGKTLVVLYLQRIAGGDITDIFSWLRNEVKLTNDKGQAFTLKSLSLAGESSPDYAASYLIFETGDKDKGFTLNFGSDAALKTIDLGF